MQLRWINRPIRRIINGVKTEYPEMEKVLQYLKEGHSGFGVNREPEWVDVPTITETTEEHSNGK